MIFSVIILVLVGVIAFFHYVQGFFSATISAILAVIAAMLALSYTEPLIATMLKGKMADQAFAMVLCSLFAMFYIIPRLAFDALVPGNVRLPVLMDKIGAAVMGIIAGLFATGIISIAAQSLPFGPSIAGYSLYPLRDAPKDSGERQIPAGAMGGAAQNAEVTDELIPDKLDPNEEKSLILPVDELVLGFLGKMSDGGSLAGDQPLAAVHPDWRQEMFGQRSGIETGAKRSALNLGTFEFVRVKGLFSVVSLPAADPEFPKIRPPGFKVPDRVSANANQVLLVVRVMFDHNTGDESDSTLRISPAAIRLVIRDKQYFPIGNVETGSLLWYRRPDDFMFIKFNGNDGGADMAFLVDRDQLFSGGKNDNAIAAGSFIEAKRYGRVDLSGEQVQSNMVASPDVSVMSKKWVVDNLKVKPAAAPTHDGERASTPTNTPPSASGGGEMMIESTRIGNDIEVSIGVPATTNADDVTVSFGSVSIKDLHLSVIKTNIPADAAALAAGSSQLTDLLIPPGKVIFQVKIKPAASNPWNWVSRISNFRASVGTVTFPVSGIFAEAEGRKYMQYNSAGPLVNLTPPMLGAADPVTLLFLIPQDAKPEQLNLDGKVVKLK